MKLKSRLYRILAIGVILKLMISGLLLGIFWELKQNADLLSPAHQAAFNGLQQSISALEEKVAVYAKYDKPEKQDDAKEKLLLKSMQAIKVIEQSLGRISTGEAFNLAAVQEIISAEEWAKFAANQDKIVRTDEELRQELALCLRYTTHKTKADSSVVGKMIKVEETKAYLEDNQMKSDISNVDEALHHGHYDMALGYLNQIPGNSLVGNCVESVKESVQAKTAVKNILLAAQRRIINDQ